MTKLHTYGLWFLVLLALAFIVDETAIASIRASELPLKDIGKTVSWLGDGRWSGCVLLIWSFVMALIAQNGSDPVMRRHAKLLLTAAVMLFVAGLLSGFVVQLIKHGLGRARPSLFDQLGAYSFEPFAFSTKQNSFPSGHSSTIGAIAMAGALLFPRYRLGFAGLALIVGLARILDGAHYVSDVLVGLALGAGISFLLFRGLVEKRVLPPPESLEWVAAARCFMQFGKPFLRAPRDPVDNDVLRLKLLIGVLFISTGALVLFISRPDIDIVISGVFFDDIHGFWLKNHPVLGTLRYTYRWLIIFAACSACLLGYVSVRCRDKIRVNPAVWGFVLTAMVAGPGLMANYLFKAHWGRARPADVDEFGGWAAYTYPFQFANECEQNCSFVTAEGSGIATLLFVGTALAWPIIRKAPATWLLPLGSFTVIGITLHVVTGRHFLSDSVFAALLMALLSIVLHHTFEIEKHREGINKQTLNNDFAVLRSYLFASFFTPRSALQDIWRAFRAVLLSGVIAGRVCSAMGSWCVSVFENSPLWFGIRRLMTRISDNH